MIARIGSMVAPFVISLKVVSEIYPPIIFGIIPIIGALLVLFLPETRGLVQLICIQFSFFYRNFLLILFFYSTDMLYQKLSKMVKILEKSLKNKHI